MKPHTKSAAPMAAANTPTAERSRLRNTLRKVSRQPKLSRRHKPAKCSSQMAPPAAGGRGRIASAGFNRMAICAPCHEPANEQTRLMAMPAKYVGG